MLSTYCVTRSNIALQGFGTRASVIIRYLFARCLTGGSFDANFNTSRRQSSGSKWMRFMRTADPLQTLPAYKGIKGAKLVKLQQPTDPVPFPLFPLQSGHDLVGHEEREFAQHTRHVQRQLGIRVCQSIQASNIFESQSILHSGFINNTNINNNK